MSIKGLLHFRENLELDGLYAFLIPGLLRNKHRADEMKILYLFPPSEIWQGGRRGHMHAATAG